jgi:hypothetical protein
MLQGRLSSGPGTQLSPGSSSAYSQSPSSYSNHNPESTSIIDDSYEPNQSFSSPVSAEVTSDNNGMSHSEGTEAESGTSADFKITQALRRLEVQLSLNEDNFEEIAPFRNEHEATHDSIAQNHQAVICKQEESAALSGPDDQGLLYDGYNGEQGNIKNLSCWECIHALNQ